MLKSHTTITAIAVLGALFAAAETRAENSVPYQTELSSCIEGIYDRIELADANRVRHVVMDYSRDVRGYEITIETTVFRGSQTTEFAAVCLARGESKPFRLRLKNQKA